MPSAVQAKEIDMPGLPELIQLLWLLFYIGIGVAIVYVILWFVQTILQLPLPQRAIQIIWGLFGLLVIIYILTWLVGGGISFSRG